MIVNQTGGGSGGEAWKHYTKTVTEKYVSGHKSNWNFSLEKKYDEALVCGTVYFLMSNGRIAGRGKFCSWYSDNADLASGNDLTIYLIDRVMASGSTRTASCGYVDVLMDNNENEVIDLTVEHSSLVSDAVTVKVVIDAFWR